MHQRGEREDASFTAIVRSQMKPRYFTEITIASAQKMSESTPRTLARSATIPCGP
jgi:hypothetical protein